MSWIHLNPLEHILVFPHYKQHKADPSWTEATKTIMRRTVQYLPQRKGPFATPSHATQ